MSIEQETRPVAYCWRGGAFSAAVSRYDGTFMEFVREVEARGIKASRNSIRNWFSGEFVPRLDVAFALADVLGTNAADWIGIEEAGDDGEE